MQSIDTTTMRAAYDDSNFVQSLESLLCALSQYSGAMAATVRLREPLHQELRLLARYSKTPGSTSHKRCPYLRGGECGKTMAIDNVRVWSANCSCVTEITHDPQERLTILTVPFHDQKQPVGVLNLFFRKDMEVPEQLPNLLSAFSELISTTVTNSRRHEEDLRVLLQEERRIFANEIHDALAQTIAFMRLRTPLLRDAMDSGDLKAARQYLGDVDSSLAVAHQRVRELITHFRSELPPQGLVAALRQTMREFQGINGVSFSMTIDSPEPVLSDEQALQILHIGREAMANVVKHAKARSACLRLYMETGNCCLSVEDDGIGLDNFTGNQANHGNFGLNIMRERAQLLGGEVITANRAEGGVCVRLKFPCKRAAELPMKANLSL